MNCVFITTISLACLCMIFWFTGCLVKHQHRRHYPNGWYKLERFIIETEDANSEIKGLYHFRQTHGCPRGLYVDAANDMKVFMCDETKPIFDKLFNRCMEKRPEYSWEQ